MIVNGSDLFMWLDDELIGSSTSYTLTINTDAREITNKGSARLRSYKPGLTDIEVSCDGLVIYGGGKDLIYDAMFNYLPVKLDFGEQLAGTLNIDVQHYTGNFIITSIEQTAGDQENATYSATFKHSSDWRKVDEGLPLNTPAYFVSTTGDDDTGDGSIGNPWATWQKGFTEIAAGDTLYIRGGIYQPTATAGSTAYNGVIVDGVDGTAVSPITVLNYPGETPVLDCVNIDDAGNRRGINLLRCDYWHLEGLEVKNVAQPAGGNFCMGIQIYTCTNINLVRTKTHHCGGMGVNIRVNCDAILVQNCDSYENYDPYTATAYDDADGFGSSGNVEAGTIIFRGCRAWNNADDGFDYYNDNAYVITDRCWSWGHGYREDRQTSAQGGSGIKLGVSDDHSTVFKREITNSLFFSNRVYGIDHSAINAKIKVYNNTIYSNGNHGLQKYGSPDLAHEYKNNISFNNGGEDFNGVHDNAIISNNSYDADWQPTGPVASDDTLTTDFISVTPTGINGVRQADGSLPRLSFLHLVAGSDLIGAGTYVGLSTDGDGDTWSIPPSIGAYEY